MHQNLPRRIAAAVAAVALPLTSAAVVYAASNAELSAQFCDALLGQSEFTAEQDIDGNGKINAVDFALMKRSMLPASPKLTNEDDTLTFVGWINRNDEPLASLIEAYNTPNVVTVQLGVNVSEYMDNLKSYLASGEDADIIEMDSYFQCRVLNDDNVVMPLSEIGLDDNAFRDCYQSSLGKCRGNDGKLRAIPYYIAPTGYAYRSDLAEKYLGITSPAEMQAVFFNWDSAEATAKALSKNGITMFASSEDIVYTELGIHTFEWVKDGKLQNPDYFKEIIERSKYWYEQGYVCSNTMWCDEWRDAAQNNKVLGTFAPSWFVGNNYMLDNMAGGRDYETGKPMKPEIYGKYDFCEGIASGYWGGINLSVAATCNSKAMAHDFIDFAVCNADALKGKEWNEGYIRNNRTAVERCIANGTAPKFSVAVESANPLKTYAEFADKVDARYATMYDEAVWEELHTAVYDYTDGNMTLEQAMNSFQKQVAGVLNNTQ